MSSEIVIYSSLKITMHLAHICMHATTGDRGDWNA